MKSKHVNLSSGVAVLAAVGFLAASAPARAQVTISHGNSYANVDLTGGGGMYDWAVDGQDQLQQQWFWYRIGAGLQQPIQMIGACTYTLDGSTLSTTYTSPAFRLTVDYSLMGGTAGSGKADIQESISVFNTSGAPLDFHLYQYSNFDLLGTPDGDTIYLSGDPVYGFDMAYQNKGPTQIAEAINMPSGSHGEAAIDGQTLVRLNTIPGLVLNDNAYAGPGDATWALQWDAVIGPDDVFPVFKDKMLSIVPIPEPSALGLALLGLAAWNILRRRH